MNLNISINNVIIIESLPPEEKHTGREIFDWIKSEKGSNALSDITKYYEISSASEFKNILLQIYNHDFEIKPLIHIEAHGGITKKQLKGIDFQDLFIRFKDGSTFSISDNLDLFININIKSNYNFIASFALCYGISSIESYCLALVNKRPLPFTCVVGPEDKVLPETLNDGYSYFYSSIIETGSLSEAYKISKKYNIHVVDTKNLIKYIFRFFIDNLCSGKSFQERKDRFSIATRDGSIGHREDIERKISPFDDPYTQRYFDEVLVPQLLAYDLLSSNLDRFEDVNFWDLAFECYSLALDAKSNLK